MTSLAWGRCGALFIVLGSTALLGACSSAQNASAPPLAAVAQRVGGWISFAAKRSKLVYIADHSANTVYIYNQGVNPQLLGQITNGVNGPEGLAVDSNGTLYVVNQLGNTVTEYPSGTTTPSVTLSASIENPSAVAIDSTGRLYVSEGTNQEILSFPSGGTRSDRTIKNIANPDGMDVDAKNHLFATYSAFPPSGVEVCNPHCRELPLRTDLAADVRVDLRGDIVVADDDTSKIYIFGRHSATPKRTIDNGSGTPLALALDAGDHLLYVADESGFAVNEYDYGTGTLVRQISLPDAAFGVALFPHQDAGP